MPHYKPPVIDRQVTLVNRTGQTLEGTWDGKPKTIPLGESLWSVAEAEALKQQNRLHGSYDQWSNSWIFKVGILEHGDNVSPMTIEERARGNEPNIQLIKKNVSQPIIVKDNESTSELPGRY